MAYHATYYPKRAPSDSFALDDLRERFGTIEGFVEEKNDANYHCFKFENGPGNTFMIYWTKGQTWTERFDEKDIPLLAKIADQIGANLIGDEGELYTASGEVILQAAEVASEESGWFVRFVRKNGISVLIIAAFGVAAIIVGRLSG